MKFGQFRIGGLHQNSASGTQAQSLYIAGTALSLVTAIAMLHPHPVVLPLLGVILVVAGLLVAAAVRLRTFRSGGPTMSQLHNAGLIMFFGFAATMLGDLDPAIKSLETLR